MFEKARILGLRAEQISGGSPVKIDTKKETDPLRIARMELRSGNIHFIVSRTMPDGSILNIPVNELIVD